MKFRFPNPDNNMWVNKYNEIIALYESNAPDKSLSLHHILPRSRYPEYKEDPNNHLYLPIMEHINIHYYLWKGLPEYCAAFWFCYVYFHKNFGYNIPEEDVVKLKRDMMIYRKNKKGGKYIYNYENGFTPYNMNVNEAYQFLGEKK